MKVAVFLTTRYGSTRLPEKALMEINGKTVTDILIERIKMSGLPIVMTTPDTHEDYLYMGAIATRNDIGFFAGDTNNIIKRHIDCAQANDVDYIILAEGDDVLASPDLIKIVATVIKHAGDKHNCIHLKGCPLGMNILAYTPDRLKKVNYSKDTNWGAKILEAGEVFKIDRCLFEDCRLTLDYPDDFTVIKHVLENVKANISSVAISQYMRSHPEICEINNHLNKQYWDRVKELSGHGELE